MTAARAFLVLCQLSCAATKTYITDSLHSTRTCSDSSLATLRVESGKCAQTSSFYAAARQFTERDTLRSTTRSWVGMRLLDAGHPLYPDEILYCWGTSSEVCARAMSGEPIHDFADASGSRTGWCRRYITTAVANKCTNQTVDEPTAAGLAATCTLPQCYWNVSIFSDPAPKGFVDTRSTVSTEALMAFAWGGFLFIFILVLVAYCNSKYDPEPSNSPPPQQCIFAHALAIEQPCQLDPLSLALPIEPPPASDSTLLSVCSYCGEPRVPNTRFCVGCKKELTFHV